MTSQTTSPARKTWFTLLVLSLWSLPAGLLMAAPAPTTDPATPPLLAEPAPPVPASADDTTVLPDWDALEAAGARVGQVTVLNRDIFDLYEPKENKALFRLANRLHVQTRPGVIERQLLFATGEPLSRQRIEETERLLRSNRYLYDVQIRPVAWQDGVVDIEVLTRDTWTLDLGASASRAGGASSSGLHLREYNLFGTGTTLSLGRSNGVDRSGTEWLFSNDRAFGTHAAFSLSHSSNSDGDSDGLTLVRPFYALDTRWAAGLVASNDERVQSVYNAGNIVSEYGSAQQRRELFGAWSAGLQDGWVQRYTAGLRIEQDAYKLIPGRTAPARLPPDGRLVAPFLRYELIEDRFERERNRNLVGLTEYFALGLAAKVQLGRSFTGLGASSNAWLYSAQVSRGFVPSEDQTLLASASISGRYLNGQVQRQQMSVKAEYFRSQSPRWLFYAGAEAQTLTRPDPAEALELGGDNGLRGYPLRYQSGTRRALFTVEERYYTDVYLWQLFRLGAAAYVDVGRAWGGDQVNAANPGWLSNVGMGLRIVNARSAFSNVLHIDLAYPLNTTPDMKKLQFIVKTRTSF
jgi:outer membrane protein assembly factor BamA